MLLAIFGLMPTILSIMVAVCSVRLGICALHGQIFYFLALLAFPLTPLSTPILWLIPLAACVFFCCGSIAAFFMVRRDLDQLEKFHPAPVILLILLNLALLFLFLRNFFTLLCLRLHQLPKAGTAFDLILINKIGAIALAIWMVFWIIMGFRRVGLSAFYALPGLAFSSYFLLLSLAQPQEHRLPAALAQVLSLQEPPCYLYVAPDAPTGGIYLLPILGALFAGLAGFFLLEKGQKRQKHPK